MRIQRYTCPKCGQTTGSRAIRPPWCWNPNSAWCSRRGVQMVRDEQ